MQGFPFANFGGGEGGQDSPHLGKSVGGKYTPIFGGEKHNFTNLMGKTLSMTYFEHYLS